MRGAVSIEKIKSRLAALEKEREELLAELREAECRGVACDARRDAGKPENAESPSALSPAEKIALFLELFGARRTVFPKFWKNPKTQKSGFSPVCENEWRTGVCEKPRVKCAVCPHKKFPALDAAQIEKHLRGQEIFGVYAIREDDSCVFLAADFDGADWADDARAYIAAGEFFGVPVALERSRSGNGAHAWIFFAAPVPATLARRLGTLLLARASAMRPSLNLESYDRFFPNQDFLPKGGFGNLIALPLAHAPRKAGNTVFVEPATLTPFADQWQFLSSAKKNSCADLAKIFEKIGALPATHPVFEFAKNVGCEISAGAEKQSDEDAEIFALKCDELALNAAGALPVMSSPEKFSGEIFCEIGAMLDIGTAGLPTWLVAALKRLATFPNPVFYEKQRLRFPTFNIPQFLFAGESKPEKLRLPRGARDRVEEIAKLAGARIRFSDTRPAALPAPRKFSGELRPEQRESVEILSRHECGVLVAPPGTGKTVIACALAARLQTRTLVLVHRKVLLEQWRAQIQKFLGLEKREIGVVRADGSVPERATSRFDIAMLPGLARMEPAMRERFFARYDLVFTDECHHVPAVTFEALLKNCVSRRVYGLTATLARKDKLERLLLLQCGPVRHEIFSVPAASQSRRAKIFETDFVMPEIAGAHLLHEIWDNLVRDEKRNALIAAGICEAMRARRFSLILSDRKEHLEILSGIIAKEYPAQIFVISGDAGIRERRRVLDEIEKLRAAGLGAALFSTGSLAGEGLDLPALDTLFLAMPVSFKGRLTQYAGRLHRDESSKNGVIIYDYFDKNIPVARAMWKRRAGAYQQFGYTLEHVPVSAEHFFNRG